MVCEKVKGIIVKYKMISSGDKVIVGVSGGPDSVALAHILNQLGKQEGFNLHIAHLNHMFRGQEAELDAESVEQLAVKLGVPYTIEKYDVPGYAREHRLSPQAAARTVRYEFFKNLARKVGSNKVATGHNADDQAETVLMNLIRGAGLAGLSGIPPVREDFYIRPLIEVNRKDIEEYCRENNLSVRIDISNTKNVYLRNRIRNQLIPLLQNEFNPQINETLLRVSNIAREDDAYFRLKTEEVWQQLLIKAEEEKVVLELSSLLELPAALQRRVVLRAWKEINLSDRDISFVHVDLLLEFLQNKSGTGFFELPRGVKVNKAYGRLKIYLEPAQTTESFEYGVTVPGDTLISQLGLVIKTAIFDGVSVNNMEGTVLVDYDKIPGPLTVRSRRPGDRFRPLGLQGTKKIKDFLIDSKIPAEERDRVPIVVSGNQVVSVGTLRVDDRWKVTADTRKVLVLKIIQEIES